MTDIKPHYGVWSMLFVQDALGILPYLARVAVEAAEAILALGLVALLIGGPLLCLVGMGLAWAFWFPFMVGVPALGISVYWLVHLPFVSARACAPRALHRAAALRALRARERRAAR